MSLELVPRRSAVQSSFITMYMLYVNHTQKWANPRYRTVRTTRLVLPQEAGQFCPLERQRSGCKPMPCNVITR
eukprot:2821289-Pleurochrysis_carterae.AAC.1